MEQVSDDEQIDESVNSLFPSAVQPGTEFDLHGYLFVVLATNIDKTTVKSLTSGEVNEMATEVVEELIIDYLE